MGATQLRTERLLLRPWRDADREPFAALNRDPNVMEHFPSPLTREQSDAFVDRIAAGFDRHSHGLWAVEVLGRGGFVGFTGLSLASFEAHFTPAVEVGWRLARSAWGQGFATEAARAALTFGFQQAHPHLDEVVSFTATTNLRSLGGHGPARHDPRSGRRLRPPTGARRPPRTSPRALPHQRRTGPLTTTSGASTGCGRRRTTDVH